MPSILPPNATPLMRALEQVAERAFDIQHPIGQINNPDTCPARFLPFLAWAYSVDTWRPQWPEHVQRARIKASLSVHRRKGTAAAVREVVASFGGSLVLREWFEMQAAGIAAPPHTFEITLNVADAGDPYTASAAYVDDIIAEVIRTKPVRSHFTFTQGVQARGDVALVAAARVQTYRRIEVTATG
ncbi:phage tail protein I [Lysobacter brunescens]|uniref:Phage tail protein I n=1 Tax=Lysobacter brunescens TaxID=262323 RepID=A0ABW2YFG5_9GAMM